MKLASEITFILVLTTFFYWPSSESVKNVNARPRAVKKRESPSQMLRRISEKQYVYELGMTENERKVKKKIRDALQRTISVSFDETPLDDVATNFSTTLGIPILLDEISISDEGIATDEPISIRLNQITAKNALTLILDRLDLTTVYENEILQVTSKVAADEKLVTKLYGFSDLELSLRYESTSAYQTEGMGYFNFADAQMAQVSDSNAEYPDEVYYDSDPLMDLLMNQTSGPWEEIEGVGGWISAYRVGKVEFLLVRQTEQVHAEVENLLVDLRTFHNTIVDARNAEIESTAE